MLKEKVKRSKETIYEVMSNVRTNRWLNPGRVLPPTSENVLVIIRDDDKMVYYPTFGKCTGIDEESHEASWDVECQEELVGVENARVLKWKPVEA